jgi:hypothetical protein
MKKTCLLLLTLAALLFVVVALPVYAQDEAAKYNFASAQGSPDIKAIPGGEGRGDIYFYNIDGNRITHITLEVAKAPSGWKVTVEPPLAETKVIVNEQPVTVAENLYVEPSQSLTEEPANVPEGMVSIKVPERGYALAKQAQVIVEVPGSAAIGTTGKITIAAEASWLGQGGAAAVKQARDFDFNVTVVSASTGYSETVVGNEKASQPSSGFSLARWWPLVLIGVIVLLAIIIVPIAISRSRRH